MIVFDDIVFESLEQIDWFIQEIEKGVLGEEEEIGLPLFKDYLVDCFKADAELQKLVSERISNEFISFVILPSGFHEDVRSFSFELAALDNKKIRKRDEIKYYSYCDRCFKNVVPFFDRVYDFYS